jgi:alkanesulfonate monooxygenase SsuD/methylene tetrahydromethanopterin reductase-like flavin-dependent oxidoreductase (luciferase family)
MDVYHFSEQPYANIPRDDIGSLRVTLPNSYCDPEVAAGLINDRLDEFALCDELGLNIMINEHHSTATCLSASCTIPLAMLARQTRRARLLGLGFPIAMRPDPVRLAEELAYIDVVSRGRLEIGFVKGAPYEVSPANANPVRITARFWDAHDLILKTLTTHDGPFAWESEWFHYRQVNIWPRPYQQPRPNVWVTGGSPETAASVGERGHTFATILAGWNARKLYDTYRGRALRSGLPDPDPSRFGYMALLGVGRTEEEGHRRVQQVAGYFRTTSIVGEAFVNPPGYMSARGNAAWLKRNQVRGRAGNHFPAMTRDGRVLKIGSGHGSGAGVAAADMVDAAIAFSGTPDQVYSQIIELSEHVGGIGNLIVMGHGGDMPHGEALANLTLFAQEVLPRLREHDASAASEAANARVQETQNTERPQAPARPA